MGGWTDKVGASCLDQLPLSKELKDLWSSTSWKLSAGGLQLVRDVILRSTYVLEVRQPPDVYPGSFWLKLRGRVSSLAVLMLLPSKEQTPERRQHKCRCNPKLGRPMPGA